jgi:hypothetical protein
MTGLNQHINQIHIQPFKDTLYHLKFKGTKLLFGLWELNTKSLGYFGNLKLIDFLSFLLFFIVYFILRECIINLSTSANCFFNYFFVFTLSLSFFILSKITLFSCFIFYTYCLCLLVWGTLKLTKLRDFLLSMPYIFFTNDRFYTITGSISSLLIMWAFLYLEICNAYS